MHDSAPRDAKSKAPIRRQLFTVISDVEVPASPEFDNATGKYNGGQSERLPAMVFMQWPNGLPCLEMELYFMWLAESGARVDSRGGSVRQEAVKLSHLVRYCYRREKNFWELETVDFQKFLTDLLQEVRDDGRRAREANQVIEISDSCVRFYIWLQDAVLPGRTIVGLSHKPHQICLSFKRTVSRRGVSHRSLHFIKNPPPSTRQDKLPIPKESIDRLYQTVRERGDVLKMHPWYAKRLSKKKGIEQLLEFRRMTWEAILTICLATGMRPGELAGMKMSENMKTMIEEKSIAAPTEKREPDASRVIPVTMNVVMRIGVYIRKYRTMMLENLRKSGKNPQPGDVLFINSFGAPLTKETLTRQFSRLCKHAGIVERTCLSMFRHRAITTLVAIHLKEFCSVHPAVAIHAMNDSNYSTILAKVASITGHKDPESLRPYINLAWHELGSFDTVNAAMKLSSMMLTLMHELSPDLEKVKNASLEEKESYLNERLSWFKAITAEMESAVEAFRHIKVDPELQRELVP